MKCTRDWYKMEKLKEKEYEKRKGNCNRES